MTGPFVKVFRTANHPYVYDVNTNALLRTDAVTADLVAVLGSGCEPNDARTQLEQRHPREAVDCAVCNVDRSIADGYLSARRPAGLRLAPDRESIREGLACGLNQLILGVTQTCNLRCRYCVYSGEYEHFRGHGAAHMSLGVARRALDFFHARARTDQPTSVSFYGGEPLVEFPLIRACIEYYSAIAASGRFHFSLTTNGTLLTREVRDFLAANDVILRVSLDGPGEVHDANRVDTKGHGTYAIVRGNLEQLRAEHPDYFQRRVAITAVSAAPYRPSVVHRYFERDPLFAGVSIRVNGVRPGDTAYLDHHPVSYRPQELALMRRRFVRQQVSGAPVSPALKAMYEPALMPIALRPMEPLADYPHPNQICVPGVRRLFVDAAGRFQPCERFNGTSFIGDLDHGFDEGKLFELIDDYIRISEADCLDCWAVRLCRTCFISANGDGMEVERKREHCVLERRSLEQSLGLYCTLMERDGNCLDYLKEMVFR